jgi:hypothetical protein
MTAFPGSTPVPVTTDLLGVYLEHRRQTLDAHHHAEALEALLHFIPSHFLRLGDAGSAGKGIDGCGSFLFCVAL